LFSDINISQGSVAMRLRYGGIFSYNFTANLSQNLTALAARNFTDTNQLSALVWLIVTTLCNRAGYYTFAPWFLLSCFFLFFLPNLSGRRLDVYHTSTHDVAVVRI